MRTLYYRVTAARVWRSAAGFTWEAHLLIRGQGSVIRGTVVDLSTFPDVLQAAVEARYLKMTGEALPPPDGQLKLL